MDCDFTKEPLWGYYFLDGETSRLKQLGIELEAKGYKVVDIFEAEMEDKSLPEEYYLHIEKTECHTIDSLLERTKKFYKLIDKKGIGAFDGFDITI